MIELSEREIDRLKRWAEVTPDDLLRSIKETVDTPEVQQQLTALLEPSFQELERLIREATKDEPRQIAHTVMQLLRERLKDYEQRLQRLEAAVWRLEKR